MPALATLLLTSAAKSAATLLGQFVERAAAGKTAAHKPGEADKKSQEAALLANTFAATLAAASSVQASTPALAAEASVTPKEPGKVEKIALPSTAPVALSPRPLPANMPPPTTGTPMPATTPGVPLPPAAVKPSSTPLPAAATSVQPAAATIVPSVAPAKTQLQNPDKPGAPARGTAASLASASGLSGLETTSRPKSPAPPTSPPRQDAKPANDAPLRLPLAGKGPNTPAPPIEHEQSGVSSPPPSLLNVHEPTFPGGQEVAVPPATPHAPVAETSPELRAVQAPAGGTPALHRSAGVSPASPNTAMPLSATTEVPHEPAPGLAIAAVHGIEKQKPIAIASGIANDVSPGQSHDAPRQPDAPAPAHAPTIVMDGDRPAPVAVYSPHQPADAGRSPSPPAPPVSEQLTRAFVAHAETLGRGGRTDFHLRLEPPQLGTVQIHLRATDHTVSARVVVALEGTRQLLEGHADQLRQSLAQAGLSLSGFDVSRDSGGSGGRQPPPEPMPPLPAPAVVTPRPLATLRTLVRHRTGGIDILA